MFMLVYHVDVEPLNLEGNFKSLWLELRVVVSSYVGAQNWTQVLYKNNRCS